MANPASLTFSEKGAGGLDTGSRVLYYSRIDGENFTPAVRHAPRVLSGRPRSRADHETVWPAVGGWLREPEIVIDRHDLFMGPIGQWTVPENAPAFIRLCVLASDVVSIRPTPAQKQHVQIALSVKEFLPRVLHGLEPSTGSRGVLRKQPIQMPGEPFQILPRIHDFQPIRHVVGDPSQKRRVLKIRHRKQALAYAGLVTHRLQRQTILATGPRERHALAGRVVPDFSDGLSKDAHGHRTRDHFLDARKGVEKILVADSLLTAQQRASGLWLQGVYVDGQRPETARTGRTWH